MTPTFPSLVVLEMVAACEEQEQEQEDLLTSCRPAPSPT
jgi:hypothetical protein